MPKQYLWHYIYVAYSPHKWWTTYRSPICEKNPPTASLFSCLYLIALALLRDMLVHLEYLMLREKFRQLISFIYEIKKKKACWALPVVSPFNHSSWLKTHARRSNLDKALIWQSGPLTQSTSFTYRHTPLIRTSTSKTFNSTLRACFTQMDQLYGWYQPTCVVHRF